MSTSPGRSVGQTNLNVIPLAPEPPNDKSSAHLGKWWSIKNDRIVCNLCPRECHLKNGDRGFCFVRQNIEGQLRLTTYGRSTGFCIDPIEKKPLNHFLPGTPVLSFGTAGCNLGCKFCQNHTISKSREIDKLSELAMPRDIALAASVHGCSSVAFTYNDPVIWAEYAIDTAKQCHELGIRSVAVTAGYISEEARSEFFSHMDAANIDLKAITEEFYHKITLSHLKPVLETLVWLKNESETWFEITNLIIPNHNDTDDELKRICDWMFENLGPDVPIHFTAFHPDFRMLEEPRTPHATLCKAYEIAKSAGLRFVYLGNVNDSQRQSTFCPDCGQLLIERDWHEVRQYRLNENRCANCNTKIPGRFDLEVGSWGRKRMPIKIKTSNHHKSEDMSHHFSLSNDEKQSLLKSVCELLQAETKKSEAQLSDSTMGGVANRQVYGAFVSLKKGKQLRSCMGFTGRKCSISEAVAYAANRCIHHAPRFPPVQTEELASLTCEIWLLNDLIPVKVAPQLRDQAIEIGRDGLLIEQEKQRGLLLPGVATDNGFDAPTFLEQVCAKAKLPRNAWKDSNSKLSRFEGISVKGPFVACPTLSQSMTSKTFKTIRQPAYAGKFYPAEEVACRKFISLNCRIPVNKPPVRSMILPHAGWRFSAAVALRALMKASMAESVIVLAPKHTRFGAKFAVSPATNWNTPVGNVNVDLDLANKIVTQVDSLIWDQNAHSNDHAIEVLLPLLVNFEPRVKIVPIAIGRCTLEECVQIGKQLGEVIEQLSSKASIIVSSDMNHFEDEETTRKKDGQALDAIRSRNPETLFNTVRQHEISMCGMLPAVIALEALNESGNSKSVENVAYDTSASVSGNFERVVGYASVLI